MFTETSSAFLDNEGNMTTRYDAAELRSPVDRLQGEPGKYLGSRSLIWGEVTSSLNHGPDNAFILHFHGFLFSFLSVLFPVLSAKHFTPTTEVVVNLALGKV
jgi:hypothetical protein